MRARLLAIGLFAVAATSTHAAPFAVTNTNDSGPGSLRQAILDANSAPDDDVIEFAIGGAGPHTIVLASALPNIDRNVIIDGGGAVVISGANAFRIFVTTSVVTLRNLTLTKGFSSSNDGGAIFNQGTLNITNCKFLENFTGANWSGGAIVTYGPLTVTNSEFGFNKADNGGAIYPRFANAVTTISGCNFHDNEATASGGLGGAILLWDGASVDIRNSTFTNNFGRHAGGAIFGQGPSQATVVDSVFTGNRTDFGFHDGGAITMQGTLTAQGSTFDRNRAGYGGAIYVPSGTANVSFCTFDTNLARYAGHAIRIAAGSLVLQDVTFHRNGYDENGNQAMGSTAGGGIALSGGQVSATNVTLSNNFAHYGGALFGENATATLTNVTLSGNSAIDGGAMILFSGSVAFTNVTVASNSGQAAVAVSGGALTTKNSIFADATEGRNLERSGSGVINSGGFNLCDDDYGINFLKSSGDKVGEQFDPLLGPLANNGGFTRTHLPAADSPAIDNGTSANAPATDQRGVTRPKGSAVDIGAVEVQPADFATPTPTPTATPTPAAKLANIATRLRVETSDNVLIGGLIITGSEPKRLIVRAIGPSSNVPGALANPQLEIFRGDELIAANDNWRDTPNQQEIIDSSVAPTNDLESAILTTLAPGAYTAIVSGVGGQTGVGSVEAYDLDLSADSRFANISTRGFVQTGDDVMIGGLIILGSAPQTVIVRAIGPSLGILGQLEDPLLELFDADGTAMSSNNNWRDTQQSEIDATSIPPSNDLESAIVATLPPAAYTAVVRGVNDATGVALVEVYALD